MCVCVCAYVLVPVLPMADIFWGVWGCALLGLESLEQLGLTALSPSESRKLCIVGIAALGPKPGVESCAINCYPLLTFPVANYIMADLCTV